MSDAGNSGSSRQPRMAMVAMGVLVLVIVMVGAALIMRSDGEPARTAGTDVVMDHVHALGSDSVDQSILVATHSGLQRVHGSELVRVGSSYQDTMGFAVVGPGEYLASGHPDMAGLRAGQSGLMGLARTVDGGQTWSTESLDGVADLHQINSTGDGDVLAWDAVSSQLMATSDLKRWTSRSTIDLTAFAADPTGERLVAATDEGLRESTDGGRNWRPLNGPQLGTVQWHNRNDGFIGADLDGTIWVERGGSWVQTGGLPDSPSALLSNLDRLVAAIDDNGSVRLLESVDDGSSWSELARS